MTRSHNSGGAGTLVGPVIGSIVYLLLEKIISGWTVYWGACLGIGLVLLVIVGKRGVLGFTQKAAPVSHG